MVMLRAVCSGGIGVIASRTWLEGFHAAGGAGAAEFRALAYDDVAVSGAIVRCRRRRRRSSSGITIRLPQEAICFAKSPSLIPFILQRHGVADDWSGLLHWLLLLACFADTRRVTICSTATAPFASSLAFGKAGFAATSDLDGAEALDDALLTVWDLIDIFGSFVPKGRDEETVGDRDACGVFLVDFAIDANVEAVFEVDVSFIFIVHQRGVGATFQNGLFAHVCGPAVEVAGTRERSGAVAKRAVGMRRWKSACAFGLLVEIVFVGLRR